LLPLWRGLSVCLMVTNVSCAKTDEPIEMSFGAMESRRPKESLIGQGFGSPTDRGNIGVTYLSMLRLAGGRYSQPYSLGAGEMRLWLPVLYQFVSLAQTRCLVS